MGFKLIAQIVLIVTAFTIIFTFVTPSLATIKSNQDELFQYKEAVLKASQFNARLQELKDIRDSFSQDDMAALDTFLPTSIDKVTVMKDIESIFANINTPVTSIIASEEVSPTGDIVQEGIEAITTAPVISYQDFEVTFTASYEDLKNLLALIEANATLLEVMELSFDVNMRSANEEGALPEGQYSFLLILRTYGLTGSEK
jgi:hypothetical protein